jgi:hypothetical protein
LPLLKEQGERLLVGLSGWEHREFVRIEYHNETGDLVARNLVSDPSGDIGH